jgi:hypothetical protein
MKVKIGDKVRVSGGQGRHTDPGVIAKSGNTGSSWWVRFTARDFPHMREAYGSNTKIWVDDSKREICYGDSILSPFPVPVTRICPKCEQSRDENEFADYLCWECR